ncbi:MAG: FAD-dependent oxidoreductase, partial [Pirellulaceae bacterium]
DRIGGLLMYGIPNMKLEKRLVDRRVDLLRQEGIEFRARVHVGKREAYDAGHVTRIMEERGLEIQYVDPNRLRQEYDALLLATGATRPRDLPIPGRELKGIHFAMDFLTRNTQSLLESQLQDASYISAKDKNVIVIGGGDTGTDCTATSLRHGCTRLVNFELLDRPPGDRARNNPWPTWPRIFRSDYGHEEAAARYEKDPRTFAILSKEFIGDTRGNVVGIQTVQIDWSRPSDRAPFREIPGSEKTWNADLILLATGFLGPEQTLSRMLDLEHDRRGNYEAEHGKFVTDFPDVFVAGDCRRGQSLVVWAINEGRGAARAIDEFLAGSSNLPAPSVG